MKISNVTTMNGLKSFMISLILVFSSESYAQCPTNAADLANGFTVTSGNSCSVNAGGGLNITGTVTVDDGGSLTITNGYTDVVGGTLNINGAYTVDPSIIMWVYSGGAVNVGATGTFDLAGGDIQIYNGSSMAVSGAITNADDIWTMPGGNINVAVTGTVQVVNFHNNQGTTTVDGTLTVSGVFSSLNATTTGTGFIDGTYTDYGGNTLGEAFVGCANGDGSCGDISLPVELTHFEAIYVAGKGKLNWTTASEYINEGFNIEKSYDGINFSKIGFIAGMGTTNSTNYYAFEDNQAFQNAYYRLKQLDFDGNYEYSPIVYLSIDGGLKPKVELYPNPVVSNIYINGDLEVVYRMSVFDLNGRQLTPIQSMPLYDGQVYLSNVFKDLVKGTYLIQFIDPVNSTIVRVVKQ